MAGHPCPLFYYSLSIAASAVTIPTTVAPTVGPGRSGRCSAARSNLPINETVATGRMIAIGEILQILPSSYVPAARPVTHSVILPVGTISLFVGLTNVIVLEDSDRIRESPPRDRLSESQIRTIHRLASEYNSAHSDVAENAAAAEDTALNDDADSATPASLAGSITAASPAGSITQVSNVGDFEDPSILGIFDFDSGSENSADLRDRTGRHAATYMATGADPLEDPFSTPIPPNTTTTEVEELRLKLAEAVRKEQAEREKFRLEQVKAQELSRCHQLRIRSRLNPTIQGCALNFDDESDLARAAE